MTEKRKEELNPHFHENVSNLDPRLRGDDGRRERKTWIPAFAGMTAKK